MTFESNDDALELIALHELRVGELETPVQVRILRRKSDDALILEQSHFVKSAIQYLPYTANKPFLCSEREALDQVAATMNGFYDQAVRRGYKPAESWLVENTKFRMRAL
jgi:hypothetical protein